MNLLKEPLIHFLVIGGLLFWWNSNVSEDEPPEDDAETEVATTRRPSKDIVVTPSRIDSIEQQFEKVWQRKPTPSELDGLIEAFVREEILYREALALGLDQDDSVVRRRLRQKMEFVSEDLIVFEPTDEDLQAYLDENAEKYREGSIYAFRQVYLKAAAGLDERAATLLESLKAAGADADISELGDSLMLEQNYKGSLHRDVVRSYGKEFAESLASLKVGEWQGPVRSGYGAHLVFLESRQEGQMPSLEKVRDAVERDWTAEKRKESNDVLYQKWREGYTVTVEERPAAGDGEGS